MISTELLITIPSDFYSWSTIVLLIAFYCYIQPVTVRAVFLNDSGCLDEQHSAAAQNFADNNGAILIRQI